MSDLSKESPFEEKKIFIEAEFGKLNKLVESLGCSITAHNTYGPISGIIINDFTRKELYSGEAESAGKIPTIVFSS